MSDQLVAEVTSYTTHRTQEKTFMTSAGLELAAVLLPR
jgi:hypothetical protein